ncbi:MAG: hypothetical protein R2568_02285 [Candidatus Scalindua sp.]|jgi:hypothetical protein|nr:hypothetical protein [Candidatus Scalindua sp.]MDV5165558.1 hypothetical protein [Candidatus Scalindua sp.]
MKVTQRLLYKSFFAVFLLFAVYGCQTTNNAVTSEPPVADFESDKAESGEHIDSQASTVEKDASATSATATDEAGTTAGNEAKIMEKFGNNFLGRLQGHGGSMLTGASSEKEAVAKDKPEADLAVKSVVAENRPYIEIERQLYGKWINKLETESYDFHDNGTVLIVTEGSRGTTMKLNGNYKIVEADRIKFDFRNDSVASRRPPSYFKVSVSESEFSLTDEPREKDGLVGPTTKYNRVE